MAFFFDQHDLEKEFPEENLAQAAGWTALYAGLIIGLIWLMVILPAMIGLLGFVVLVPAYRLVNMMKYWYFSLWGDMYLYAE